MRKSITNRTVERLTRAAYDFADLAARLRAEGFINQANAVEGASKSLRAAGDSIAERLRD